MARMAPPSAQGHGGPAQGRALTVLVLIVSMIALTGCIQEPDHAFNVRQGDLVTAQIVAVNETTLALPWDSNASSAQALCGGPLEELTSCPPAERAYTLGPTPAEPPSGYEDSMPLPSALANELQGASPGEMVLLEAIDPWGPHDEALVEEHEINDAFPRFVDDDEAYGVLWETESMDDGEKKILPGEDANGTRLFIDRWCNERFCLFESILIGYNETHLLVEHQPLAGQQVHVPELDTTLTVTEVTEDTFVIDGNHRYAGVTFDVFVNLVSARGPPSEAQRAPGFEANALNDGNVSLEELLGNPVVLEFFATWCPSCEENANHLNRIHERFGDTVHIVSIGIDPWEEGASFQRFIDANDVSWPVIVDEDGSLAKAYSVGSLSTGIVISPEGFIVHTETGVANHERVVAVLEGILEVEEEEEEEEARGQEVAR